MKRTTSVTPSNKTYNVSKRVKIGLALALALGLAFPLTGEAQASSSNESTILLTQLTQPLVDYTTEHKYTRQDVENSQGALALTASLQELVVYALKTSDQQPLNARDALERPAFYELKDGKFTKNKFYFGVQIENLLNSDDKEEATKMVTLIAEYKKAPGLIPNVIGLNDTTELAKKNGVAQAPLAFFFSKWNTKQAQTGVFTSFAKDTPTASAPSDYVYQSPSTNVPTYTVPEITKPVITQPEITVPEVELPKTPVFSDYEYFTLVEWITRNGVISLSLYPTEALTGNKVTAETDKAFEQIKQQYQNHANWSNTGAIKAQYDCHVIFAGADKVPWNLEPHRTETDLWKTVMASCNPEPAKTAPPAPTLPATPEVVLPEVELPEVELPELELPETELPEVTPETELPEVELPEIEQPEVTPEEPNYRWEYYYHYYNDQGWVQEREMVRTN